MPIWKRLISDELYQPRELFALDGLQVACGTMGMPTATVRLRDPQGTLHVQAAIGTGPVDATFKAMNTIVQCPNVLQEFVIHAVTEGIDALGEVTVRIQSEDKTMFTAQSDSDQAAHLRRLRRGHGYHRGQRQGLPGSPE